MTGARINVSTRAVRRSVPEASDRLGDRHQLDRRRRVRLGLGGRAGRRRPAGRPLRFRRQRPGAQDRRRRALLPRVQSEDRRQDLSDHHRWRFSDGLLPQRRPRRARPAAAQDLGRVSRGRRRGQRQGHERRRRGRFRLLHVQEAQRPELLRDHVDRGTLRADPGHRPGHLLRHRGHDPDGQQRGLGQGVRDLQGDRQVRAAGGAEPRHRRHPRAGDQRPLRAGDRLGRHRPALDRSRDLEGQGPAGRRDPAGLDPGARLGDRRAGRLHARALPLRHRRRQPRAVRGVRRLVGRDQRRAPTRR